MVAGDEMVSLFQKLSVEVRVPLCVPGVASMDWSCCPASAAGGGGCSSDPVHMTYM